ncbi:MAG: hypothetical protein GWO81_07640 [Verrucomicrobia bacterium]|nr:hypothetical protein [Verrucomicrobiota bacterium]
MKTTIELPDDLGLQAKRFALEQHTTLKQLVITGLRLAMASTPAQKGASETGYTQALKGPLFVCKPNAPAEKLSIEELVALEHQCLAES